MKYEVTAYFSEVIEVEAENENEAITKAQEQIKNINTTLIADNYEAVELED